MQEGNLTAPLNDDVSVPIQARFALWQKTGCYLIKKMWIM